MNLRFKKEAIIFLLVTILILGLNFVLADSQVAQPSKNQSEEIKEPKDVGKDLGFEKDSDVTLEKVTKTNTPAGTEVVLSQGGKIGFSSELDDQGFPIKLNEDILSENLDLSKKNRFVFKDGMIVEAEFYTKSSETENKEFILNGASFEVPPGSKVIIKDGKATIYPGKENSQIKIPQPAEKDLINPMQVSYITNGKNLIISSETKAYILNEGELLFTNNKNRDVIMKGEKIVFGSYDLGDSSPYYGLVLRDMVIYNKDPNIGTALVFQNPPLQDIPYIMMSNRININDMADTEKYHQLTGCVVVDIGECESGSPRGVTFSIVPDSKGNSPDVEFKPGNIIFPGMGQTQSIRINPNGGRVGIFTGYNPVKEGDEVRTLITTYSEKAEIQNSGAKFVIKKSEKGFEWYSDRSGKKDDMYPMTIISSEEKSYGLTVNRDTIEVEGKPVILVKKETKKDSTGDKLKTKVINTVILASVKLFGEDAADKIATKLYEWFYPNQIKLTNVP